MSLQVIKPYITVNDANGLPIVGASLYVYQPGTTTLASVYTDEALSVSAANPATSDANGNFPRLYIAAGTYKLRAVTSASVLIFQEDNIDTGLSAGTGALPISRGGTGATTAAAARSNLDVPSNSELSDLSAQIVALQASLSSIISTPQGRLTLTSGSPVLSAGVSAAAAVYYTPYLGNLIPIYNGTNFAPTVFTELTLTLVSNHVASNIYDVFVFNNSGTLTLVTGPAWNVSTAGSGVRGTGAGTTEITRTIGGLLTNANTMTARNGSTTYSVSANQGTYVGSIFIDTSNGQVSCHTAYGQNRKFGVWNAFNRVPICLRVGDSTSSWSMTNTGTFRQLNNSANNVGTTLEGLAEEYINVQLSQNDNPTNNGVISMGIGVNSASVATGFQGLFLSGTANVTKGPILANATIISTLGITNIAPLESSNSTSNQLLGTEANTLTAIWWRG